MTVTADQEREAEALWLDSTAWLTVFQIAMLSELCLLGSFIKICKVMEYGAGGNHRLYYGLIAGAIISRVTYKVNPMLTGGISETSCNF